MSEDSVAPVLRTARLTLAMPPPSQAPQVVAYLTRNHARYASTSPDRSPPTVEKVAEALAAAATEYAQRRSMRLYMFDALGDPSAPIGNIALSELVGGPFQACFLGYRIDAEHEGKGLVSEAIAAVVAHAFGVLDLHRIMANHLPTNERSARTLRRAGFVVEGYARDYLRLNGEWRDHVLTSLTNPGWVEPT